MCLCFATLPRDLAKRVCEREKGNGIFSTVCTVSTFKMNLCAHMASERPCTYTRTMAYLQHFVSSWSRCAAGTTPQAREPDEMPSILKEFMSQNHTVSFSETLNAPASTAAVFPGRSAVIGSFVFHHLPPHNADLKLDTQGPSRLRLLAVTESCLACRSSRDSPCW